MLKRFFIVLIVFLAIDIIWLAFISKNLYKLEIGHLMAENVNFYAAVIFYLIYSFALLIFIVNPSLEKENIVYALIYGSFIGFAMYATYDLTNLATLKNWSLKITIIDLIWGSFISGFTSVISVKIIQFLKF